MLAFLFLSASILAASTAQAVSTAGTKARVASSWYAGWHATEGFPLSDVSWHKYTQITYAFAETTPDVNVVTLKSSPDLLTQFVATAHQNGVKAVVSVGGWTGSRWWSSNVGSAKNRTAFVKTLVNLAKQYDLDGLDFDWEYPNNQGIGCNMINEHDSANFLSFLKLLRKDPLGSKLVLSAATAIRPFMDVDGNPSGDISAFSKVLDYVAVMVYDIWGPWSPTAGPNAPLNDTCAAAANQGGSAVSAVQAWTGAGMPADQIVLGVPSYGHSYRVYKKDAFVQGSTTQLAYYPAFNASDQPLGDSWDDPAAVDECGVFELPGGNVDFWGLIQQGYLNSDGTPQSGIASAFDTCSQTAFVYNETSQIFVSYDSAETFAAKGQFIKDQGLRGFAMWETGGDSGDILLDSIRQTGGF